MNLEHTHTCLLTDTHAIQYFENRKYTQNWETQTQVGSSSCCFCCLSLCFFFEGVYSSHGAN